MRPTVSLWLSACLLVAGLAVSPSFAQEASDRAAPPNATADVVSPDPAAAPVVVPDVSTDATPAMVAPLEPSADPAPPAPAQPVTPPAATCGAPANPWGYSYCGGSVISSPPANLCSVFACISSFWRQTNGYVIQCRDGLLSHSGGVRGSCSSHGGNSRPLYAPA